MVNTSATIYEQAHNGLICIVLSSHAHLCRQIYNWNIAAYDVIHQYLREGPGVKSRMCPPYPQRVVKGD